MTIIYAATEDQHLVGTIIPKLAQNNINTVRLHVVFDNSWNSYSVRSAIFTTSKSERPYPCDDVSRVRPYGRVRRLHQ